MVMRKQEKQLEQWQEDHSLKGVQIEYVTQIDYQTSDFIEKTRKNELTRRGSQELNWILKYPWAMQAPLKEMTKKQYYFSLISKRFFYLAIKILDDRKNILGFVICLIRNKMLYVPYFYCQPENGVLLQKVICMHCKELGVEVFVTYQKELMQYFKELKYPYFYEKKIYEEFMISKKFEDLKIDNDYLQDGDGDCAFWIV